MGEMMNITVKTLSATGTIELNITTVSSSQYNGTKTICSATSDSSTRPTTKPNNDNGFYDWVTVIGKRGGKKTYMGE